MISYIDTNEVENIAKDLAAAADDLEAEFKSLFDRFSNVPTSTKEWTGNQARFYFSRVAADQQQYTLLVEKLRRISQELSAQAADAENQIRTNNSRD